MPGDELRQAISGKTVYLNISGFELPIRYTANGRMSGKMSTIAASFSRGDGASDTGKWWVADDQLCQQWSSWMDGKSYCYKLTPERLHGAVGAQRRPFRHRPHRRLSAHRIKLASEPDCARAASGRLFCFWCECDALPQHARRKEDAASKLNSRIVAGNAAFA